jgi:hypothetical protein
LNSGPKAYESSTLPLSYRPICVATLSVAGADLI